jgi:hypothetical protein
MKGRYLMDFKSVLFGIVLGFLLMIVLTLLTIFFANQRFVNKNLEAKNSFDNKYVKDIIKDKKKQIVWSPTLGLTQSYDLIDRLTKELVHEIATFYYPKSKFPVLEITLYEVLELTQKVSIQLKAILDHKAISPLKNLRLSNVKSILEVKKTIEDKKAYKFFKEYKLEKLAKSGYMALNFMNPFYWVRKLIFTSAIEIGLRSIGVMTMHIIGGEADQLYNKKILVNDKESLEEELDNVIKEIESAV